MKEILRDKQGKIYDCTFNRANLSMFQLLRHIVLPYLLQDLKDLPQELREGLAKLGIVLVYIVLLPVLPFMRAVAMRRIARKEIARHNKRE